MSTENPRIATYPNIALYERLKKYQEAKGLKTLSKAVITVLEDYFRQLDMPKQAEAENEIESIKQELAELQERVKRLSDKVVQLERSKED